MIRRYLLDTGPAFDFLFKRRGIDTRVEATRRTGGKIGICTPVLGEIVGGLEGSGSQRYSWQIAREYGRIYADLKRRGRPMQQVDIQIAAIAITLGNCAVISGDSDLAAVKGLHVENWIAHEGTAS